MRSSRFVLSAGLVVVVSACGSVGDSWGSERSAGTDSASISEVTDGISVPESDSTNVAVDEPRGSAAVDSVPESTPPAPSGDGALPFGLQQCSAEFSVISADPDVYRDEPVYVGNDQPTEAVRSWAEQQPGFVDIWIDRANNGWIGVGFTSDVGQRQADLETEFPGVGVAAVKVEHTMEELDALRNEVFAVMSANGIAIQGGGGVPNGEVDAYVGVLDEATLEPFADFAGDPVCFDGVDPEDAVIDGPQPTEGDGWRLLTVEQTGPSRSTGVATDAEQYAALWNFTGVTAEQPEIDFDTEIVIWFGAVYGSGCEIRMDDVVFDLEQSIVHGDFVTPGNPGVCNEDANPEAYLVAVERTALPVGPFSVQLSSQDPQNEAPDERTVVDADLSERGAIATDEQIRSDNGLAEQPDRSDAIGPGGNVEPGVPTLFEFDLACPVDVVGPINDIVWQSLDPQRGPIIDPAWQQAAEPDDIVFTQIDFEPDSTLMFLTANGVTENYQPGAPDLESPCES